MKKTTIEIDELAPGPNGPNGLRRMHWARYKRLRDNWTWKVMAAHTAKKPYEKTKIRIVRHHTGRGMRDYDNLYASAKLVLDALRRARVIADDDMDHVVDLAVEQERVPKRQQQKTVIEIWPLN